MDQQDLNMTLFLVTAAAAIGFAAWQIRRAKKAKKESNSTAGR